MKALLLEGKDEKRSAIVLLPSGKLELEAGDPASIIMELDGNNFRVYVLTADEFSFFKENPREVEVNGSLLVKALEYRNARTEYERTKVEFRERLFNEMIDSRWDAGSYLKFGPLLL